MAFTIVLTDLDGTLLDHESYSWEAARPALDRLCAEDTPCIFVSSKTRAEVESLRRATSNTHPYIVENGGALVIPNDYFRDCVPGSVMRAGAPTIEWGCHYTILVDALRQAAASSGCNVRGFHDMSVTEVARECAISEHDAELAKTREYDEPFLILNPDRAEALREAIEAQGLGWTAGGRFQHITGANDKGKAVKLLLQQYEQAYGDVFSIGLGDSLNDIPLLQSVSLPYVMPTARAGEIQLIVPRAQIAQAPGPEGWNSTVLSMLSRLSGE